MPGPGRCAACGGELDPEPVLSSADLQGIAPGRFSVLVCPNCGSGRTAPEASEDELADFYAGTYGPHERSAWSERSARLIARARLGTRLLRGVARDQPGALLDVGCGRGELGRELAQRGWKVSGIEPAPTAAAAARDAGLDLLGATVSGSLLPAGSFDAVLLHHSLEHLSDPLGALERVGRSLRSRGRVLITLPNFASLQRHRHGDRWWALDLPRHRTHFTPAGLARVIERAGLSVEEVWQSASLLGPAANLQVRLFGRQIVAGAGFLTGYALAACAYPLTWAAARARRNGEFVNAVARTALRT